MNLSFRSKLLALVAPAALALVALVVSSAIIAGRVEGHLDDIRRHYLPKLGLRPQLEEQLERIQRGFQDAVAASDTDKLARTAELKKEFLQQLAQSSGAVDPGLAAALEQAVEDFHSKALSVSTRLIARETGEGVVAQMGEMQASQTRVAHLLDTATVFDKAELTNAFSAAADAQRIGSRIRLGLSLACLLMVLLLSLWISRDMLAGMAHLTAGFSRFGEGDFRSPIPVVAKDELGVLARQANQMAQSLQRLESERSRVDSLKGVQSALSEQLRGELEPREVADRALSVLCRSLQCPVGALYIADPDGAFQLLGRHAVSAGAGGLSFRPGEGLAGQAALQTEITVVQAPADQLRITSGLAEGSPRAIALVPLIRFGNVLTSGRHLLRLINDVLDLAKVESGRLEFRPEPIDLPQVIGEVNAILRTTAADKNVRVEMAVDPAIGPVALDPARLKQVLYNYLSNALKFTPSGGLVTVRASPEGADFFRLEVHDTGSGIEPQDLPRLFVEFQQLDTGATKKHAGTGLGLALTKRIVEAQGGSVGVRSTPGVGSVFHALLSRPPRRGARPALAQRRSRAGAPEILVVEDNPADQTLIVEALSGAGYSVQTAATGAQALAKLRERAFDAMTLDLLLPDMSGVDLLARIRDGGPNAQLPVIVLTVVAEEGAVAGFRVSDVLAKPIETAALLDALRRAGVAAERRGAVLVVDDDPGCLRLMEATLGRSGFQTICRQDGEAALQAAAESRPVAVVLDLIMPRVDGFEFLERFRRTEAGRRTPVIVWTVKDLSAHDHARLRETAHAVVAKGGDGAVSLLRELNTFLPAAGVEVRREPGDG